MAGAARGTLGRAETLDPTYWLQADCHVFVTEDLQPGRVVAGMRLVDPFAERVK
jgi:predicted nucleic acid-binding protein